MKLGIVIGTVWASKIVKEARACKFSIVQPVSSDGQKTGRPVVAADPQHLGGSGDLVLYVTSTDAAQSFESGYAPVNASIVELVDEIS
jgi:microcompartment protein CcmK/EutM